VDFQGRRTAGPLGGEGVARGLRPTATRRPGSTWSSSISSLPYPAWGADDGQWKLLRHFGSIHKVMTASEEVLREVALVSGEYMG
jgi:hypothetical protein